MKPFKRTEVRGLGMMAAIELVADKATKQAFAPAANVGTRVAAEMLKGGPSPSIRRGSPPSTIKPHQLPEKEFSEWYEANVLRPARTFNGR